MTFFSYRGGNKETFQHICGCGCIKFRTLVSTDNTLEADFYLHVHVSFHVQVTSVGVHLVDEF